MNPITKLLSLLSGGLTIALLAVCLFAFHWRGERDELISATSIAAHAADKKGHPITLSTKGAVDQIRILGKAIDDIKVTTVAAERDDAQHVITTERKDATVIQKVSANVLAKLDRTQADLAASRALAAQRLRELKARTDQGRGGETPVAADPDAVCDAAFAASCDEVLTLLAEAERNTAQLVGWQEFWPQVKANHDGAAAEPPPTP